MHIPIWARWIAAGGIAVLVLCGASFWLHRNSLGASTLAGHADYDVVVVGAGPGGIGASVQAARMGMRVALLEPTDWVGGQMTAAGVGNMDEGSAVVRGEGLYGEFVQKVLGYYASKDVPVGTCYGGSKSICVDPRIGQLLLRQLLQETSGNLQLFTGAQVTRVLKQGNTVQGVAVGGRLFTGHIVIDADEYGDILPLAGADYRLGNGTGTNPKPASCVQDITYTAVIRKYPTGVPSRLVFHQPVPGYTPAIASRFAAAMPHGFAAFAAFRGLPDLAAPASTIINPVTGEGITRTSLNLDLANDFPPSGTLSTRFVSDPIVRVQTACQAKLLTLQLIYYIQHDLGQADWSIANDEGYDTQYNRDHRCENLTGFEAFEDQMPQEPYVREARRVIGTETLTGNNVAISWQDSKHIVQYPDSIAVGYYPMDMHNCRSASTLEPSYDMASDAPPVHKGGPFNVPIGTLIPAHVDGLLVAEKNISASRLANGAMREQPIAMDIGQAAGALAALAVKHHEQPRFVPASEVQTVLSSAGLTTSFTK